MRALLVIFSALLLLRPAALSGQTRSGAPNYSYTPPNALFAFTAEQPMVCVEYAVESGHRQMGIRRMYQYQLVYSRQLGLLGFTADSVIRYLSVSMDVAIPPHTLRHFATIHFRRNGEMEIGRMASQVMRTDSLLPPQVYGLSARDAGQALDLARYLATRCH